MMRSALLTHQLNSYNVNTFAPQKKAKVSDIEIRKDFNLPYFNDHMVNLNFTGLGSHLKGVVSECAMCGGKVYSEEEIAEIVKTMLPQAGNKLQNSLTSLMKDLTQPDKSHQKLIKDKNESVLKKRVKTIKSLIRASKNYPAETLEGILENRKSELFLFPGKLQNRSADEIMKYLYIPFIESVDHFEARINGGKDNKDNYVQSCLGCNNHKSDMAPKEFLKRYPEVRGNIDRWNKKYFKAKGSKK